MGGHGPTRVSSLCRLSETRIHRAHPRVSPWPSLHLTPSEARAGRLQQIPPSPADWRVPQAAGGRAERGCGLRPAAAAREAVTGTRGPGMPGPASLFAGPGVPSGLLRAFDQHIIRPPGAF